MRNHEPMPDPKRVMGEPGTLDSRESRFTDLFMECYGPVLAFARRRVDDDLAQDVVAEAFLTAWRHLDDLSGEPLHWLYRVANHAIANQRRGLARRQRLDGRVRLLAGHEQVPDLAEAVVETRSLVAAFRALSERDREVLRLVNWEGLNAAAAASVLDCSPATFKVRLYRARRRLSRLEEGRHQDPSLAQPAPVAWKEPSR